MRNWIVAELKKDHGKWIATSYSEQISTHGYFKWLTVKRFIKEVIYRKIKPGTKLRISRQKIKSDIGNTLMVVIAQYTSEAIYFTRIDFDEKGR